MLRSRDYWSWLSFIIVVFCWGGGRKEKKKGYLYEGGGRRRSGGLPAGGWWWRNFELIWEPWLVYSFAFFCCLEDDELNHFIFFLLVAFASLCFLDAWICLMPLSIFDSSPLLFWLPWCLGDSEYAIWFLICMFNDDLRPVKMFSEGLGILTGFCGCLIRVPWILALYLFA